MRPKTFRAKCARLAGRGEDGRTSAAARGYGHRWRQLRRMVLRGQPLCARCGAPATDVDHVRARRAGGTDALENLQALCHACHSAKTAAEQSAS